MDRIEQQVEEAKLAAFLSRVSEIADGSPERLVPAGGLGEQLGLPYEEALRIADRLARRGMVRRAGPLEPPYGPRLRLTPRGAASARVRRAA